MSNSSFTILGSSSGKPQPQRACSGYLLEVGESLSLIDCGAGVTASFLRLGFDTLAVDRIFITHAHSDHVGELTLFIQMVYLAGREEPLDLYLPDELVEPFRAWLRAVYLFEERLPFALQMHGYAAGVVYDDDFRLTAHETTHLHKLAPLVEQIDAENRLQCHSFQIDVGGRRLLYSGDIGGIEDIRPYLDGCDYVVTELTHVVLTDFLQLAQTARVGRFIVTHLGDDAEVAEIVRAACKAGLSNLAPAFDGLKLELDS